MTDTTVNMKIKVSADTSQADAAADRVKKKLEGAYQITEKGAVAAARRQASMDSGGARGIGGQTGAEGRDFAKQAQGLGGLVHIYATFAANIFAVSTAFNALSKAMDTTNMVKGLDQLGASSGRALGSLSKQLVLATDSAISLRDAMQATAMASAAGMTNSNILKMGQIAKSASQALGINMTDAVNRLSRGITKLEPELLDELGIFVRVDTAAAEYARTIGKTASSLTDFEKRQAFAFAVLEQGTKKFSAIDIESNPYSKLAASAENLLQSGLEVVNKVLGPLVGFLASSPTGLAIALSGIAGILLKQAIPALGMIRQNAREAAEQAEAKAKQLYSRQQEAQGILDGEVASRAKARFNLENKLEGEKIAKSIFNQDILGKKLREITKKNALEITDEEISALKARQKEMGQIQDAKYAKEVKRVDEYLQKVNEVRQRREDYADAAIAKRQSLDSSPLSTESQLKKISDKAKNSAAIRGAIASAVDEGSLLGFKAGFEKLGDEVEKTGAGKIQKTFAKISGTISLATSAVGRFISAFGVWGQIASIAGLVFSVIDSFMSTGAKQAEEYATSVSLTNDAYTALDNTLTSITKKSVNDIFNVDVVLAQATALSELTTSLSNQIKAFDAMLETRSGWENFFDWFKDKVGAGAGDKLALSVSRTIFGTLKTLEGPAKEEYKNTIQRIVGQNIDFKSVNSINSAFKDRSETVIESIAKEVSNTSSLIGNTFKVAAENLKSLKDDLTNLTKESQTIATSLLPNDQFSKIGTILLKVSQSSFKAFSDGTKEASLALRELFNNTTLLSELPKELQKIAIESKNSFEQSTNALAKLKIQRSEYEAQLETATKRAESVRRSGKRNSLASVEVDNIKNNLSATNAAISEWENRVNNTINTFASIPATLLQRGIRELEQGLILATTKAAINFQQGVSSLSSSYGNTFTKDLDSQTKIKEINLQIQEIDSRVNNTLQMKELTLAIMERNLFERQKAKEIELGKSGGLQNTDSELQNINKDLLNVRNSLDILRKGIPGIGAAAKDATSGSTTSKISRDSLYGLQDVLPVLSGAEAQKAGLNSQKAVERIKGSIESVNKQYSDLFKNIDKRNSEILGESGEKAATDRKIALADLSKQIDYAAEQKSIELEIEVSRNKSNKIIGELSQKQAALATINLNINKDSELYLRNTEEIQNLSQGISRELDNQSQRERDLKNIGDLRIKNKKLEFEYSAKILDLDNSQKRLQNTSSSINLEVQKIELANKLGQLTEEEYYTKTLELSVKKQLNDLDQASNKVAIDRVSIEEKRQKEINDVTSKLKEQGADQKQIEEFLEKNVNPKYREQLVILDETENNLKDQRKFIKYSAEEQSYMNVEARKLVKIIQDDLKQAFLDAFQTGQNLLQTFVNSYVNSLRKGLQDVAASALTSIATGDAKGISDAITKGTTIFNQATKSYGSIVNAGLNSITSGLQSAGLNTTATSFAGTIASLDVKVGDLAKSIDSSIGTSLSNSVKDLGSGIDMLGKGITIFQGLDTMFKDGKNIGRGLGQVLGEIFLSEFLGPFGSILGAEIGGWIDSFFGGGKYVQSLGDAATRYSATGEKLQTTSVYDYTPEGNKKAAEFLDLVNNKYRALANSLGVATQALTFGYGANDSSGGKSSFRVWKGDTPMDSTQLYGVGDFATSNENIALEVSRGLLAAIKGSDLPKALQGIFDDVDISKLDQSGINDLIAKMQKFTSLAKSLGDIGIAPLSNLSYTAINGLAELAGGIDNFTALVSSYYDSFFSKEEKTANIKKNISKTLIEAGVIQTADQLPKTRGEFRALVDSLQDVETAAGKNAFMALMQVSGAFASITTEASKYFDKLTDFDKAFLTETERMGKVLPEVLADLSGEYLRSMIDPQNMIKGGGLINPNSDLANLFRSVTDKNDGIVDTKDEFVNLYIAAKNSGAAGADLVNRLETMIPAVKELSDYASKIADAKLDQQIQILRLLGKDEEALALSRKKTLDSLDPALVSGQVYINQLEDQKTAFDTLISNLDKFSSSVVSIGESFATLMGITSSSFGTMKTQFLKDMAFLKLNTFFDQKVFTDKKVEKPKGFKITEEYFNEITRLANGDLGTAINKVMEDIKSLGLSTADTATLTELASSALSSMSTAIADVANNIKQLNTDKLNKVVEIYTLLGRTEEALAIQRNLELSTIDASLKPFYEYLYALQDEQTIKDKLKEAYQKEEDRLTKLIDSFDGMISALKEARKALLLGTNSTLTPKQKFLTSQTEYQALQNTISSLQGKTDDASIKARNEAINKLPQVSNEYLDAARTFYASSTEYSTIFDQVTGYLSSSETRLSAERDISKEQLTQLQTSTGYLEIMKNDTRSIKDLTNDLSSAQAKTKEAAEAALPLIRDLIAATSNGKTPTGGTGTGGTSTGGTGTTNNKFTRIDQLLSNATNNISNGYTDEAAKGFQLIAKHAADNNISLQDLINYEPLSTALNLKGYGKSPTDNLQDIFALSGVTDTNYTSQTYLDKWKDIDAQVGMIISAATGATILIPGFNSITQNSTKDGLFATNVASAAKEKKRSIYDLSRADFTTPWGTKLTTDKQWQNLFADAGISAFAKGGYMSGLSLVGEKGPELVDFDNPGRVYTAEQTAGMFNAQAANKQLIEEIKQLRDEVRQLREQQRIETGHVINATFEANAQNAETIVNTVQTTTNKSLWANKTANSLAFN